MKPTLTAIIQLMRADRPIGTVLLAMPMLWALWLAADGSPSAFYTVIFLVGAWVMRSAGCVINDFADRKIDGHVQRTQQRPLVQGIISARGALIVFAGLLLIAFFLLLLLPARAMLPAVITVMLVLLYPLTKRFFDCPQLVLGMAFSCAILMVYITIFGRLPVSAWLLMLASICWTLIYDTLYALVDAPDDAKIGVKSSARWFGRQTKTILLVLMGVFLGLMAIIGLINQMAGYYYLGLLLAAGCFCYQMQLYQQQTGEAFFAAFLNNQWVGVLIFLGIMLSYLP